MVYVHVPFCGSFCTYCGFYSEICASGSGYGEYESCILREIWSRRSEIEATLGTNTLYIGGGTPSVLPFSVLENIVNALDCGPYEEFTVEVNPEDIVRKGPEYVSALRSLGVNRISMGVQSLDDGLLRWMKRRHDSDGARRAFGLLREGGFDNISVDIIMAVSGFGDEILYSTVREILTWKPEHISAYQLSVEEGSALEAMCRDGRYTEADEERSRRQYLSVCDLLRSAGYGHYEISNWALPGRRAIHNSAYWKRVPYVGLGPAAHSFSISGGVQKRSWNSESVSGWTSGSEILTAEEIAEEEVMLGLRTAEGWNGRILSEAEWMVSDGLAAEIISRLR